ncbi:hypothetical protein SEA_OTTERSTEDTS21_52 [Gordonia phage OtterstedtS21]|nr:hypothetical protein HWC68_gp54 [Gordonia phage Gibbin]YP_009854008.1 hypothetical protein HWC82_gp54 [Gordonia phage Yikes]QFG08191.1 hypothetical protein PBI_GRETELLYN_52 [Gordonia phage GretelLyn]UJQ86745.1 hypothetical protein SEA_JALEBI_52 [Gordonia phage Jalebi]UVT31215.1 hypothetical protein SEA_OTTERSTEDTS21_52 [Gordonia phage OtterstedtS21]UVT31748.1 hypothetical protein SEA_PATOS_55 [Gordonia phage Patos]WNM69400.1 hypothetical protein SEA_SAMPUDON_53 [Gordonia phage Sampudon]WN
MKVQKPIPLDHGLYDSMRRGHLIRTGHRLQGHLESEDGEVWKVVRECCLKEAE